MKALEAAEARERRRVDFLIRYGSKLRSSDLFELWWKNGSSRFFVVKVMAEWCFSLGVHKSGMKDCEKRLVKLEAWLRSAHFKHVRWVGKFDMRLGKPPKLEARKRKGRSKKLTNFSYPDEICVESGPQCSIHNGLRLME